MMSFLIESRPGQFELNLKSDNSLSEDWSLKMERKWMKSTLSFLQQDTHSSSLFWNEENLWRWLTLETEIEWIEILQVKENMVDLFLNIFPLLCEHDTLGIIGLIQVI